MQRHAARRLHYDLRLERGGALASWAVPKGVPEQAGQRHLAVHVEDHPLDYADFEGEIPAGQYGAGTVEIWDRGTYELLEEKRNGGLTVELHGERLRGVWTLVPAALDGDPRNWLLIRKDGDHDGGQAYRPMLATSAEHLPAGADWAFEPKWDGYRALVTVRGGEARLTSRNGNDLTDRFPEAARAVARALRSPSGVLDGEVCSLDDEGRSSFGLLQRGGGQSVLVLFDVLELDGERLLDLPLTERRERLQAAVDPRAGGVALSPQFDDGDALLAAARQQGLEGVVAKRLASRYQPGTAEPGLAQGEAARRAGARDRRLHARQGPARQLARRARAGGQRGRWPPLGGQRRHRLHRRRGRAARDASSARWHDDESPLAETPRMPRVAKADVVWVEPKLVADVRFAEWTTEGRLRAPVYVGLRDDKAADDVRRERAPRAAGAPPRPPGAQAVQPRQAVLARRRDHQGRPHRLLPGRRAGPRSPPARAAVHDEAVPGRVAGEALLPEGHAEARTAVAAHGALSGDDARRRETRRSTTRSSRTTSRCCGS